jgi:(4-(4-[2-(gamma-L-glutamylamino)ethyl]phenoxymethyl)furan-2-yl)methanamine synthase
MTPVLGLDIGGANLKAAHTAGAARSQPFALWKQPDRLADALRDLLAGWPPFGRLAVTMTGELCDCFPTRRAGVLHILGAVEAAAGSTPVLIWHIDGSFHTPAETRAAPLHAAAANWLALAVFAGRFAPHGRALLIDVGSTTTDVVALRDSKPIPLTRSDPQRLRTRELVYTGVRRTPACAVLGMRAAAEFFATTHDAYLLLGRVAEDPANRDTADGRPAAQEYAHARLARMLCGDGETVSRRTTERLAQRIYHRQRAALAAALDRQAERWSEPPGVVIVSGSGEFLAEEAVRVTTRCHRAAIMRLSDRLGAATSAAVCAHAVAVLAAEAAP